MHHRFWIAIALVLGVAGCTDAATPEAVPTERPLASTADAPGPCALLTEDELSGVIGPLAGAPYRAHGTTPDVAGDLCRIEALDLRSVVVSVVWQDGGEHFRLLGLVSGIVSDGGLGDLELIEGTHLAGEWDEARAVGCCEFHALRGDSVVTIDISGTRATLEDAAGLANHALLRLEDPLAVDDAAAVLAALEREHARPRARSVCDLVTRADAEAFVGRALATDPVGDSGACTYVLPLGSPDSSLEVTLAVEWRDGFRSMRGVQTAIGQTTSMIGLPGGEAAQETGPWDEYAQTIVGVMAVKRDVLASVESGPFAQDIARAFVVEALENLDR